MLPLVKNLLTEMLTVARDLNEPGEVNAEYVRGQVNLITDVFGLAGIDWMYDDLTNAVTWREDVAMVVDRIHEWLLSGGN